MEGSRLILKRKASTEKKKRLLFLSLFLGLSVAFVVMVLQLKTTLSAQTLSSVKKDVEKMRSDFTANSESVMGESTEEPSPITESLSKLKSAFEEAVKADAAASAEATAPQNPEEASTTPVPEQGTATTTTPEPETQP
jgi:signal transduction histidine kinase